MTDDDWRSTESICSSAPLTFSSLQETWDRLKSDEYATERLEKSCELGLSLAVLFDAYDRKELTDDELLSALEWVALGGLVLPKWLHGKIQPAMKRFDDDFRKRSQQKEEQGGLQA